MIDSFYFFFSCSFAILLNELFTLEHEPYENTMNTKEEVIEFLISGKRLSKPEMADELMYEIVIALYIHICFNYKNDGKMLVYIAMLSADIR